MKVRRILVVLGTRPEVVKLSMVMRALEAVPGCSVELCVTGQHRDLVDPILRVFGMAAHHRRAAHEAGPGLSGMLGRVVRDVGQVIEEVRPDCVVVQGDTTSALGGALAATYAQVPVAHVEAGLRAVGDGAPWPEEAHRRAISALARWHFAPTVGARDALVYEGVDPDQVHLTGNPVVDALQWVTERIERDPVVERELAARFAWLDGLRDWILVTGHRRENLGPPLAAVCDGLREVLARRPEVGVVWPLHPNPAVRGVALDRLGSTRARLLKPVDHVSFVYLMQRAAMVVTDSGGVQEEAPWLGCPVLVTRTNTERPEAVEAGAARLVGPEELVREVLRLLDDAEHRAVMGRPRALFGDGRAGLRIADILTGGVVARVRSGAALR